MNIRLALGSAALLRKEQPQDYREVEKAKDGQFLQDCTMEEMIEHCAQFVIAGEAVTAEDGAADDGLQQIVSETHAAKDAQMMEHTAYTLEGIPCGDHCRDDHQEDTEVVDWFEPAFQIAKVHETQGEGEQR